MTDALRDKLKTLPAAPGVYFHKSKSGEIIYVGKAAVFAKSCPTIFPEQKDFDVKTLALVNEIDDTDWVETESEIDALFLESEMVKRYMPRYNVLLRDDKSQLFVRIDMNHEWPYVDFTRGPLDDGATYIGPFYNGYAVRKALRYLRRVFPYFIKPPSDRDSSLDRHIGLSPSASTTSAEYKSTLRKLIRYIEGGRVTITNELEREMKRPAREQEFERAADLRNKLQALRELQRRIMFGDKEFQDISKDKALVELAKLLGLSRPPKRIEGYDISHMSGGDVVASMVVFTNGASDRAAYRKFKMSTQRNDDFANMRETLTRRLSERNRKSWGLPDLILVDGGKGQLDSVLEILTSQQLAIPCVGIAKREEELIVHRTKSHINDSFIQQLITQPIDGVYVESTTNHYVVNLHVGQRNAGSHSRNLRGGSSTNNYAELIKLFQRIRDESHRFAVSYHTVLKRARQTQSLLDDIPGIGPTTKKKLLRTFGSTRGVMHASMSELSAAIGPAKGALLEPIIIQENQE